ncbi:MAG: hypothetical protein ABI091_19040 [Ferruginibacter sp.]
MIDRIEFLANIIKDEAIQMGYKAVSCKANGKDFKVEITDDKKRIIVDVKDDVKIQVIMTVYKTKKPDSAFHKHLSQHYLQLFGSYAQGLIQSELPFVHGFQSYDANGTPYVKYYNEEVLRPYMMGEGYDPKYKRFDRFKDFYY